MMDCSVWTRRPFISSDVDRMMLLFASISGEIISMIRTIVEKIQCLLRTRYIYVSIEWEVVVTVHHHQYQSNFSRTSKRTRERKKQQQRLADGDIQKDELQFLFFSSSSSKSLSLVCISPASLVFLSLFSKDEGLFKAFL